MPDTDNNNDSEPEGIGSHSRRMIAENFGDKMESTIRHGRG